MVRPEGRAGLYPLIQLANQIAERIIWKIEGLRAHERDNEHKEWWGPWSMSKTKI